MNARAGSFRRRGKPAKTEIVEGIRILTTLHRGQVEMTALTRVACAVGGHE
ncbi:hypothetical protein [Nocardia sp. MW-W600-9]